jgi:nitrogen fixation/metabolism regulation signal transduction histidine kinase
MRALSISKKATLAAVAVLLLCSVSSGAGMWAALTLSDGLDHSMNSAAIMRNHMNADMMHDAIRADVYTAILSADPKTGLTIEDAKKDFDEHRSTFERAIEANAALADARMRAMFATLKAPFIAYVAGARQIIALAETDVEAAKEKLESFDDLFKQLEKSQADVSDIITAANEANGERATQDAAISKYVMGAMLGLAILFALALMGLTHRAIVRPLVRITGALDKLAGGDLRAELPPCEAMMKSAAWRGRWGSSRTPCWGASPKSTRDRRASPPTMPAPGTRPRCARRKSSARMSFTPWRTGSTGSRRAVSPIGSRPRFRPNT